MSGSADGKESPPPPPPQQKRELAMQARVQDADETANSQGEVIAIIGKLVWLTIASSLRLT